MSLERKGFIQTSNANTCDLRHCFQAPCFELFMATSSDDETQLTYKCFDSLNHPLEKAMTSYSYSLERQLPLDLLQLLGYLRIQFQR